MSNYMDTQNARAQVALANFAASANRAGLIRAVVDITKEVERHANQVDPRDVTAVSVLVDLVVELAQGLRHVANIMDSDAHPATVVLDYPVEGPEWPANMLEPEVAP